MTHTLTVATIRNELSPSDPSKVLNFPYPKPYPDSPRKTKAILLGCDPSNKHSTELPYVFAIKSELGAFNSFVLQLEKQLAAIGLSIATVYSQNLCRNYFENESSQNRYGEKLLIYGFLV